MSKAPMLKAHDALVGSCGTAAPFMSVDDALCYSTEVLRRRRLPKLSSLWQEVSSEAEYVARFWQGEKNMHLPTQSDEVLSLALKVEDALTELGRTQPELAFLLRARYWGDWHNPQTLHTALTMQEKLRRQGIRVRISYRYSYRQLATLTGLSLRQTYVRSRRASQQLETYLRRQHLVAPLV